MLMNRKRREEIEAKLAELQSQTAVRLTELLSKTEVRDFQSLEAIETRMKQRKVASHAAVAHIGDDRTIDVTIVDFSIDGIRVTLPEVDYLPEKTIFECTALGGFIVAVVRWQDGREAGLQIDREWTRNMRMAASQKAA